MITFQKQIAYDGDLASSPLTSVEIVFQVPIFEYAAGTDGQPIARRATADSEEASITQPLDAESYSVALKDAALTGSAEQKALARQYYANTLESGTVHELSADAVVRYLSADGRELGTQGLEFLCIPRFASDGLAAKPALAVNQAAFETLRTQVSGLAPDVNDALLLRAVASLTTFDGATPILAENALAELKGVLGEQAGIAELLEAIRAAFPALYDFALVIPEISALEIAGSLTIRAPSGAKVSPRDFLSYELVAEGTYTSGAPLMLSYRFDEGAKVTDGAAAFTMTADKPIYRGLLEGAVIVRVQGLEGMEWSREFSVDDPTLAAIAAEVRLQRRTELRPIPGNAGLDRTKKLRGRVLTLNKECSVKDVQVFVQAKTAAGAPFRVLGAGPTDSAGNFSVPYPYGTYTEAQAFVSLAPNERVGIPIVAGTGEETIADDFLYLLLNDPKCPPATPADDCDCTADKPNRLPDFSDLIDSDAYTQDIGGSCVNLSKPNRTINEFNYRAVVRTSDPSVASYTLNKIETGVESIDISLSIALENAAAVLSAFAATAMTNAAKNAELLGTVGPIYYSEAVKSVMPHVAATKDALSLRPATSLAVPGRYQRLIVSQTQDSTSLTFSVLVTAQNHVESVITLLESARDYLFASDQPGFSPDGAMVIDAARNLKALVTLAIDTVGTTAKYELLGSGQTRSRQPISLSNPVAWQDAPDAQQLETLSQAVTVATGHVLHYKALFKADGYSMGDLIYSLPLAPGQKKQIVVFDASHTLAGAESQSLSQNERLAAGLVNEREITNQLAGGISESLRGSSSANTNGISAGFGTGGQGSGGTGAYGGSGSAVLGIAGGVANANSNASQDSSRDVAQFFGEKLRQSIMQNADGYRQMNASVVTTVQEGQRYGVTSEVVVNHNHCHALTIMYFEVLRHYAIFQELSSVEECVFVPLLLTKFSTENVARWRDVLAPALLPMPSDTYLQPFLAMSGSGRQHPLVKAFDADQRIKTHYANIDYPEGSYDDEPIRFLKGEMRLRMRLPRPKTRYDRILSLPIITQSTTTSNTAGAIGGGAVGGISGAMVGAAVGEMLIPGLGLIIGAIAGGAAGGAAGANIGADATTTISLVKQQIFDLFMQMDANFQTVPPAQCIRVKSFQPTTYTFGPHTIPISGANFFDKDRIDEERWKAYATLLGFPNVLDMLDVYFAGRLIAEWDQIFNEDIAPIVFEKIVDSVRILEINADFSAAESYHGGERVMQLVFNGTTTKKRNQLPPQLKMFVSSADVKALKKMVTLDVETLQISYSTSHYNGLLFSDNVNDDLLDDTMLDIPVRPDEKRNPRREDRYLAAKLIEHLNSNLEYYNKVLWFSLDPDRRYMLLDGFSIQTFDDDGLPIPSPGGLKSLASVVKNELIAVAGNSLVFPVAPGYRVSGSFIHVKRDGEAETVTLFDHYAPLTPLEPYRISVPSKGVFAEAVQGACNACEKVETDRLQDWNRYPIGDEPTGIMPITTPTPVVTDWKAAFKDFATPMINIQNAPGTPAPGAGLAGLSELLGKSGVFKDVTGLDANQQNVLKTYLSNQENAKAFGQMAKEMAMQSHNTQNSGKIMDTLKTAKDTGAIDQGDYGNLVKDHLQQQIDGGQTKKAEIEKDKQTTPSPLTKAFVDAVGGGQGGEASRTDSSGAETYKISPGPTGATLAEVMGVVPIVKQQLKNDCWAACAAMMTGWKERQSITAEDAVTRAGQKYLDMYRKDTGLSGAAKDDFLLRMRLTAEPMQSASPQKYVELLKDFGLLWITIDSAAPAGIFAPHARLVKRISGTGTPDGIGTELTFIDPRDGRETTETFADFVKKFEEAVFDNQSKQMTVQVVHFLQSVNSNEGFQIEGPLGVNEPIHETITLAALVHSAVAMPATIKVGESQPINEFLRGVIWNDDPAGLLFDEDLDDNWNFSFGIAWYWQFKKAHSSETNDYANLTGRSHYFDLQFLHAMAAKKGEAPLDTLAKILLWAEVMYKLSIGDGVMPTERLGDIPIVSSQTDGAVTYSYRLSDFFHSSTVPKGTDTLEFLLTQDSACISLDVRRRAIGSLLHMIQDSYARGHVRRRLLNPMDSLATDPEKFKPGKYGKYGEVENFHYYSDQNSADHDKYDKPGDPPPAAGNLESFNEMHGARDAIDAGIALLDLWRTATPWAAPGGAKELLEATVFKISATATPADATV